MSDPNTAEGLCSRCDRRPANAMHTCPYQSEINDDNETECDCCDVCQQDCCDDI